MRVLRLFVVLLLLASAAGCAGSGGVQSDASSPPPTETSTAGSSDAESSDAESSDAESSEADAETDPEAEDAEAEDAADEAPPEADASATEAPQDWFHQDAADTQIPGMATDDAYALLSGRTPQRTVTVAIIDSGVDAEHEDLTANVWVNEDETPSNGVDDDGNGYVDDVNGWNFIGGPDGENVGPDTYELTRIYVDLRERFEGAQRDTLTAEERDSFAYYQEIKRTFREKQQESQQRYGNVKQANTAVQNAADLLRRSIEADTLTQETLSAYTPMTQATQRAKSVLMYFYQQGLAPTDIKEIHDYWRDRVEYGYNPDFNPRPIVGDDYSDTTERIYGNTDVEGPDASHGTHVAGIVGAVRSNGLGMDGVATGVRIMPIRAVPNGDERDKDVANAIRYAADNGAHVINMSFGKGYSPEKEVVDAAVRYADSLGVLMIHAAGNDGENVDSTANFPTRTYLNGGQAQRWIEVGASSWEGGDQLAASFSNYGAASVDVFAPGVSIYSTIPDDQYERIDGTSMAAPMVTGLAALLMAYHPDLTALQVRDLILETATPYAERSVTVPQGQRSVPFGSLSRTGAIVNAEAALQRAAEVAP